MDLPKSEIEIQLFNIFDSGVSTDPLEEIIFLAQETAVGVNRGLITTIHGDIRNIFNGTHPDFEENSNKYHNLRHTYSVVLATVRLFHGLSAQGCRFTGQTILNGIISAYFHDTGLLLRSVDSAENGAEYLLGHETRSIQVLKTYLESIGLDSSTIADSSSIIRCTNIELALDSIPFRSEEMRRAGQIVGTADIVAQMADRFYLEQLPHLYQEKKIGGLKEHESVFELMKETTDFYHDVIRKRLEISFDNVGQAMRHHFKTRWDLDMDLYGRNIERNVKYLQTIVEKCKHDPEKIWGYLQRQPPVTEHYR